MVSMTTRQTLTTDLYDLIREGPWSLEMYFGCRLT